MAAFVSDLFDLVLIPFQRMDSLIVMVPAACLTVCFAFGIIKKLMGRA